MDAQTKDLVRTPAELAPLIKEQIQFGDVASQEAGMPYYRKAGGLLLEAKPGVKQEGKETFDEYCKRITNKDPRQCRRYIQAYVENLRLEKKSKSGQARPEKSAKSLNELAGNRSSGRVFREWTAPVDAAVDAARKQQLKVADDRVSEQKQLQELARKLIDIGFKVLAKELHPDKMGGSKDAMARLNKIRSRLHEVYG